MFRCLLSAVLMFSLGAVVAGAAEFSSLEERMSGDEFTAAGLDRLTPEELARLNNWLRANWPAAPTTSTPYPATADTRGFPEQTASREAIVSQIKGEFSGWQTGTVFRLANGMVWEVSGPTNTFAIQPVTNPTVIIEPAFMGSWLLRIEGYNSTVRVKRKQ